ncbi:ferroxidase fet3 [Coemansia sp. RSA 2611]|nr:ferroxidase fet3 [Coemansia sp. RSA 2705]KAJ2363228.1 ferroxidase fet3 [Coemansia sp. RSA 2610]KAJ2382883.1 ferroxidase fet3 [Coemansia sp. RSA 2611]
MKPVALLSLLAASALGKRVVHDWDIGYVQANPDGQNQRRVIGVNGKWPPPAIEVDQYDILAINVHNSLDEATSVHAHGFHQRDTPFMDGVPGVTECGIAPNGSFTYEYNVTQSGTYWLHSHYQEQYIDGLRSPLIVRAQKEPHHYDHDVTMMLEAWYHRNSKEVADQLLSTSQSIREAPFRPYMLVNSRGGTDPDVTKLRFEPGKTYRLRILNVSATAMIRFGIEEHEMRVIEVDGTATEPKRTNSIQLSVGQRASVLVTAKSSRAANYMYRADIFTDIQSGVDRAVLPFSSVVEYAPNAPLRNVSDAQSTLDWDFFDDIDLVPIDRQPMPGVNKWVPLEMHTGLYDDRREHITFNNRTYETPIVPSLISAITTGYQAFYPDVYGFKSQPVILDPNTDVEIALFNRDNNTHTIHLHGHSFFVYRRGSVDGDKTKYRTAGDFPVRRDTVAVPPREFVLLRIRADNPGVWFLHCHQAYHNLQGLAATFIEAPYFAQQFEIPEQVLRNCQKMGIPAKGNAMGRNGLDLLDEQRGPFPLEGL